MKLTRRTLVLGAVAAPLAAKAQSWPPANIRIVVVYPPGGSTDAMMRLVQTPLQDKLGTTVIIENRAGASGSLGTAFVAKSPPDGNTWVAVFDNHAANPFVLPSLPYDTEKDLDPVLLIGTAPYLISTSKNKPYQTLKDVLDALGGHVDLLVGSTALSMPQVNQGNLRALAQTGKSRNPFLTQVPTVAESGFPDFEAYAWWGIFAPAGTPKPIIETFGKAMADTLRDERIAKQLVETQQVTLTLGDPLVEREFLAKQMQIWGKVAKDNNIKADQN